MRHSEDPAQPKRKKKEESGGLFWNGSLGSCSVTTQRVICESSRWSVNSLQNSESCCLQDFCILEEGCAVFLRAFLVAQLVENLPAMWETPVQFLGRKDPPGEGKGYPLQYSGLENSMDCISPWDLRESDMTDWLTSSENQIVLILFILTYFRFIEELQR